METNRRPLRAASIAGASSVAARALVRVTEGARRERRVSERGIFADRQDDDRRRQARPSDAWRRRGRRVRASRGRAPRRCRPKRRGKPAGPPARRWWRRRRRSAERGAPLPRPAPRGDHRQARRAVAPFGGSYDPWRRGETVRTDRGAASGGRPPGRAKAASPAVGLDETVAGRDLDQLGGGTDRELVHEAVLVERHGARRDAEVSRQSPSWIAPRRGAGGPRARVATGDRMGTPETPAPAALAGRRRQPVA